MKNYLILALECKVFRRSPLLRVFINNCFVDEFELKNGFFENKFKEEYLDPKSSYRIKQRHKDQLMFIKLYEFRDPSAMCDVRIECFNNDSNYTNGFMTKSTLVKFRYIFLISASNAHIFKDIRKKYAYSIDNFEKFYDIKKYYSKNIEQNYMWENFSNVATYDFDGQDNRDHYDIMYANWIGGSGSLKFTAKKHMGIWRRVDRKPGVCRLGWVHVIEKILNKYLHDENQRSSN